MKTAIEPPPASCRVKATVPFDLFGQRQIDRALKLDKSLEHQGRLAEKTRPERPSVLVAVMLRKLRHFGQQLRTLQGMRPLAG
ncbi:hypothetical protein B5V02_00590 [Mesorhizobium kowhaii]|uniref:Uncharacterized protein n=1 Tax=Mesorhizobium kowhaii TaxID=1300272 RepID=A0A2W7CGB4_9HYPH|nr:hypothetical protein B5V02_00590 [Mesorhizobium kowhaii]